ncbi:hypothetical protein ACH5RR_021440 [Cinchona calisaya]|uniref:Secreted peptide n=1 Tax=Cinchona calisaya TaxID=153742 RepID=A0ABD2ZHB8_9GENT
MPSPIPLLACSLPSSSIFLAVAQAPGASLIASQTKSLAPPTPPITATLATSLFSSVLPPSIVDVGNDGVLSSTLCNDDALNRVTLVEFAGVPFIIVALLL